ncbi:MAG: hypothetical protein E7459_01975 [Ruminococcaceae bacterium]|nr:hypothetical protein [Oscillospiraceae bacterium]
MAMNPNAINYLSLARKAGRIEVGEEPVGAAARSGHARLVLVASDAPDNTRRRAKNFVAGTDQQMVILPFTKEEMGTALGRTVVALAAMTDPAMALAFLKSLGDEKQYAGAVEQLTIKADRMRRHQQELKAHEKNIRTGKTRKNQESNPQQAATATPAEEDHRREDAGHRGEYRKTGFDRRDGRPNTDHRKPQADRRNTGYTPGKQQNNRSGKVQGTPGRSGHFIDNRGDTQTGDSRKTGKWDSRDGQKHYPRTSGNKSPYSGRSGGTGPQYRKESGKPAGKKYATVNKVAGRKPGRKTHGGAEV